MKIGYFADGPWSHRALEKIAKDDRFQVVFIVPRYETQDPKLKDWAERLDIDYLLFKNVNQMNSIEKLMSYGADLFVSMSFDQILKKDILEATPLGFINCHAGALPHYRGRNILNWVLINDEKEFGVTVHYIDEGIDTGDIILQKMEQITDQDDYSTLLNRATIVCANLLFESLIKICNGTTCREPQSTIHPVGLYCSRRKIGDEWIDWNWSSRRIFNFVRAITEPGPCARTMLDGYEVVVKKASLIDCAVNYIGTPGEIVGTQGNNVIVKTGDSTLLLKSLSPPPTIEKFRIGYRFGPNLLDVIQELKQRVNELEKHLAEIDEGLLETKIVTRKNTLSV